MLLAESARKLGRSALDLVFPPRCGVCGRHGSFLCAGCEAQLVPAASPRCPRCWRPGADASECFECAMRPPAFDLLRAAFVYQGPARELVHGLKYRGLAALAEPMGRLLGESLAGELHGAEAVVPVPLSGRRRRTRGYNQAEALARPLAAGLGLPVLAHALSRARHTPPQARSADADTRARNVAGAFTCREPGLVGGRRVLLVDDVTTTGATLSSCAGALKAAGAAWVLAVAFARED